MLCGNVIGIVCKDFCLRNCLNSVERNIVIIEFENLSEIVYRFV